MIIRVWECLKIMGKNYCAKLSLFTLLYLDYFSYLDQAFNLTSNLLDRNPNARRILFVR